MSTVPMWIRAARAFVATIEQLGDTDWDAPGLGEWSVRDLIGHATSAGINTVAATLDVPVGSETIDTPEGYYALGRSVEPAIYAEAVAASTEDARRTGRALGADPRRAVRSLVETAIARVGTVAESTVVGTAAGGMRLGAWLPTRTFELAVHGVDVSAVVGWPVVIPDDVLADAAALAARIAIATGDGVAVLQALTGRGRLPDCFSVV
jgi:uncharacterized protein (TIGR03083 family)